MASLLRMCPMHVKMRGGWDAVGGQCRVTGLLERPSVAHGPSVEVQTDVSFAPLPAVICGTVVPCPLPLQLPSPPAGGDAAAGGQLAAREFVADSGGDAELNASGESVLNEVVIDSLLGEPKPPLKDVDAYGDDEVDQLSFAHAGEVTSASQLQEDVSGSADGPFEAFVDGFSDQESNGSDNGSCSGCLPCPSTPPGHGPAGVRSDIRLVHVETEPQTVEAKSGDVSLDDAVGLGTRSAVKPDRPRRRETMEEKRRIQASQADLHELFYMLEENGHTTLVSEARKQFLAGVRDTDVIEKIVGRLQRYVNGLVPSESPEPRP